MADATIEAQAQAICDILSEITDIGLVFDHQVVPRNDWTEFVKTFSTQLVGEDDVLGPRHVRAWTITMTGEQRDRVSFGGMGGPRKVDRRTSWLVRGFMTWTDATDSDSVFRSLLGDVANALDSNVGLCGSADEHDGVTVTLPNDGGGVVFGEVLCHYAEIRLVAKRRITEQTS